MTVKLITEIVLLVLASPGLILILFFWACIYPLPYMWFMLLWAMTDEVPWWAAIIATILMIIYMVFAFDIPGEIKMKRAHRERDKMFERRRNEFERRSNEFERRYRERDEMLKERINNLKEGD